MKVPAPALALSSMICVQLGAALSTHLFDALSPAGSSWIRVTIAAVILLAITRPRLRGLTRSALLGTLLLGTATGLMTLAFIEAVARIPLGTAVAIEFLGPLTVASVRAHRRSALVWPALALIGVILLTRPWTGQPSVAGIGFAVASAVLWGGYILLTQRVGAQLQGLQGLAISLGVAALVSAPFGAWPAIHGLTPVVALQGLGLAVLVPMLPFAFEMLALRRMSVTAFGTLMALEPGFGTAFGLILLAQTPRPVQVLGVLLVIAAGIGAQRKPRTAAPTPGLPRGSVPDARAVIEVRVMAGAGSAAGVAAEPAECTATSRPAGTTP